MNTRKIRNEKILPDVTKMKKIVNGQEEKLSAEEKYEEICKVFGEFFKQHINYYGYGGRIGFFYGLRDDFFTDEMFNRISIYGDTYYNDIIKRIQTGKSTITKNKELDIRGLQKLNLMLKKEIEKQRKHISRVDLKNKRNNPNMLSRLVAVNKKYLYDENNKDLVVVA